MNISPLPPPQLSCLLRPCIKPDFSKLQHDGLLSLLHVVDKLQQANKIDHWQQAYSKTDRTPVYEYSPREYL